MNVTALHKRYQVYMKNQCPISISCKPFSSELKYVSFLDKYVFLSRYFRMKRAISGRSKYLRKEILYNMFAYNFRFIGFNSMNAKSFQHNSINCLTQGRSVIPRSADPRPDFARGSLGKWPKITRGNPLLRYPGSAIGVNCIPCQCRTFQQKPARFFFRNLI